MHAFIQLLEIDEHGNKRGNVMVNLNSIIFAREVDLPNGMKACRLVTTKLSADDIMAAELRATASYSDSILVAWGLDRFAEALQAFNEPVGKE